MKVHAPALVLPALLALSFPTEAQCPPETLAPSSGMASDLFGFSVDVEGTRAVVGAPFEGPVGTSGPTGAAYVYEWDGSAWVESAKLTPVSMTAKTPVQFGYSVAVSGDRIVVGAPFSGVYPGIVEESNNGAAYVFEKSKGVWSQTAELHESLETYWETGACQLGTSIDIEGDTIVAGLPEFGVFTFSTGFGAVDVFQAPFLGVMTEFAHLDRQDLGSSAISQMGMGQDVAIAGNTIVAGAPSTASGPGPGRVFVFELQLGDWSTGLINKAVLTNSDAEVAGGDDEFGRVLDISGDTIVVSAFSHSVGGTPDSGKVYTFEKPGASWVDATETASLHNGGAASRFGTGVAIDEVAGTLLVGDSLANLGNGAGYVYEKVGGVWTEIWSLAPPDGVVTELGTSAAMSGDHRLLGAPFTADIPATPHGVAWDWSTPLVLGMATVRNGLGVNPVSFASVNPPVIGTSWNSTIDIVTPGATASMVGVALGGPWSGVVLSGSISGEILIQLAPEPVVDLAAGAHTLPVPPTCGLIGVSLSTQGLTFAPGDIRLVNALDLVFGSH